MAKKSTTFKAACPKCRQALRIELKKETVVKGIPAETKEWIEVEKDSQTKLVQAKKEKKIVWKKLTKKQKKDLLKKTAGCGGCDDKE